MINSLLPDTTRPTSSRTIAMENVSVPFADLHAQYLSIKEDIDAAIADVIRESSFIRGPHVERFEAEFAAALDVAHCVSCGNGTDALYIAMHALGVRSGDEVITTAHSWIATSETVTQAGAKVVFCDTDNETFTIDPAQIEAKITPRTVGIIPVHLYGQPADMDAIMAIARKHKLWVIEDCAQSHLARYKGKLVGTFGDAASFSFYPGKNLGAMGDAGAVVTRDAGLAERMAMYARHGGLVKGDHQVEGINSRLDGMQAAILSAKLPHLEAWTQARVGWAAAYTKALAGIEGIEVPVTAAGRAHVYHLYVVRHAKRDQLAAHLKQAGIQTSINYPVALPFLPAYRRFEHVPEQFPNAFAHQNSILSLPLFPEMTNMQLELVVKEIGRFCQMSSRS
jgi:dTDP-4-amino-4,6-dideoxygalactose transaminase